MKVEVPEVVVDAIEVVEAAQKTQLITPKRVGIAIGAVIAVTGTVFLIKKIRAIRAAKAEAEDFEEA